MSKRYRAPKVKPGQIRMYYGKADQWDSPDVCFAWGGGGADKRDAGLLHLALCTERMTYNLDRGPDYHRSLPYKFERSILDELVSRGYDITTLKVSIEKRKVNGNTK